ncbi:MAG TPA: hypothetical protein VF720_07030 [Candidatus Eisenbacteria bacterium]
MYRKTLPSAPPDYLSRHERTQLELLEIKKQTDLAVDGTLALLAVGVLMFLVLVGLITLFRAVG